MHIVDSSAKASAIGAGCNYLYKRDRKKLFKRTTLSLRPRAKKHPTIEQSKELSAEFVTFDPNATPEKDCRHSSGSKERKPGSIERSNLNETNASYLGQSRPKVDLRQVKSKVDTNLEKAHEVKSFAKLHAAQVRKEMKKEVETAEQKL